MASASTHNYTFYNLTGINDDVVGLSEVDLQNQQFGSYTTQNFFEKHCGMIIFIYSNQLDCCWIIYTTTKCILLMVDQEQ